MAGVEVGVGTTKLGETTTPAARSWATTCRLGATGVKAHKAGYQPWEQEVQVSADQRMEVAIDLQAAARLGWQSPVARPGWKSGWGPTSSGRPRRGTPLVRDNLPPGSYRVKAQKPGYQLW